MVVNAGGRAAAAGFRPTAFFCSSAEETCLLSRLVRSVIAET